MLGVTADEIGAFARRRHLVQPLHGRQLLGRPEERRRLPSPGRDSPAADELAGGGPESADRPPYGPADRSAQCREVSEATALGEYDRYNMQRMVTLGANIAGDDLGRAARRVQQAIEDAGKPPEE